MRLSSFRPLSHSLIGLTKLILSSGLIEAAGGISKTCFLRVTVSKTLPIKGLPTVPESLNNRVGTLLSVEVRITVRDISQP